MAKTILGVDIGHDQLKLALVKGTRVIKTASAAMPENLLRNGRITSRESLGELIRMTMKQYKLRANNAAFVLSNDTVYIKNVDIPQMTIEQLQYNLPFEFQDYITGEPRDYVFDYAVVSDPEADKDGEGDAAPTMELMAVGTPRAVLEDAEASLRKAGLRLIKSAPALSAYISLLRVQRTALGIPTDEYAVLDLGYEAIRMYMFKGDKHIATRVLETGMSSLDGVLADAYGVDVHLAHTYLMSNFENCQQREECRAAYENIAVEMIRVLNFYHFSNPQSALSDLWLCGGGAFIQPLADTLADMLDIQLHSAEELVPGGDHVEECNSFVQAIGITID